MPAVLITVAIYAKYIQPFPFINGAISWAGGIFSSLFLILEMGTNIALPKFFSANRVNDPKKAIMYAQIFTWWMLAVTSIQGTVVVVLGSFFIQNGEVAYLTYFLVLASITRIPGCFGVIGMVLDAMQRFNTKIKLDAILGTAVNTVTSYIIILLFRALFTTIPSFGEAFGAGLGIYIGSYVNGIVNFSVYATVFKKMGYSVSALFRAEFGKQELKEVFTFGGKLTIGNGFYGLTSLIQTVLISIFVLNYNTELGVYNHVGNLTQYVGLISGFTGSLIPAISEADSQGKKVLLEYYLVEGIKWSYFFMFFLVAVFFAIGNEFLAMSGEQWLGSLKYVPYYVFFSSWFPLAWYVDAVFQGTGHPGYNTIVWYVEQGTRLVLLFLLLPTFQLFGLIFSYIPGIMLKGIVALVIIRKKILAFKPYWMHTLLASAGSAVLVFAVLKIVASMLDMNNDIVVIATFVSSIIFGLFLHGLFTGLLGGWCDNTVAEFSYAIKLSKFTALVFSPLSNAVKIGHRACPWKNKFCVAIHDQAAKESLDITRQKVAMRVD